MNLKIWPEKLGSPQKVKKKKDETNTLFNAKLIGKENLLSGFLEQLKLKLLKEIACLAISGF